MLINSFIVIIIIIYHNQHISYGFHLHYNPKVFQFMPTINNNNINRKDLLTQSQHIVQAISSSTASSSFPSSLLSTPSSPSSSSLQSTSSVMKTSSSTREINRLKNRDFEKNLKLGVLFLNLGGPERMEVSRCYSHSYHNHHYHKQKLSYLSSSLLFLSLANV